MRSTLVVFAIFLLAGLVACDKEQEQSTVDTGTNGEHNVVVEEVVHATQYTYLRVKENGQDYWIAVTKREVDEGASLYFSDGLEMNNFESKDLQRTFDKVLFVQDLSTQPSESAGGMAKKGHGKIKSMEKSDISVKPAQGGISISELYSNRNGYSGKTVKISGQVTKFNQAIMGRNWVHVQDGTKSGEDYDLTVTTNDVVKVGEVVTFEGKIVLNKDFGAGYAYDVIMEEAKRL